MSITDHSRKPAAGFDVTVNLRWALVTLVTLFGLTLGWGRDVAASGLQVQPVSVAFNERSDTITLSNTGPSPIQAQVRVYRWTQGADGDQLDLTDDVVSSPPMVSIQPNGRHLVRLVRMTPKTANPSDCETAYRLKIDEIPAKQKRKSKGLRYVMSFSVPVFITSQACGEITPDLRFSVQETPAGPRLRAINSGRRHAQLAQAFFTPANGGPTQPMSQGLLGYVLANQQQDFALVAAPNLFAAGGTLDVQVNGAKVVYKIAPTRTDLR
jgi:fimbrial chaperone protein